MNKIHKIGVGAWLEASDEFWDLLDKCVLFKLRHPTGGQANDGFELNGLLKRKSADELLELLDQLGVTYQLHDAKPELAKNEYGLIINWCWPITMVDGVKYLELNNRNTCLGFNQHIEVSPDNFTITINMNSNWSYVALEDVEKAIAFEQALQANKIDFL